MRDDDIDRSLIEAAREGLGPTDEDRARVRRAVRAAIAGGAAIGAAGAATTASAAAKGAIGAWTIAKVIAVGAGVLTIAVGTTWGVMEATEDEPEVVASASEHEAAPEPVRAREQAVHLDPSVAPEPAPVVETELDEVIEPEQSSEIAVAREPERAREVATRREAMNEPTRQLAAAPVIEPEAEQALPSEPAAASPDPRIVPPSEPAPRVALAAPSARDALTAETALLRDAHAALRAHDPARALAILEQHAASFPSGALAEERSATRVLALCDSGRIDQARAEASRFLAAHPRSMHAGRVRASSCAPQ